MKVEEIAEAIAKLPPDQLARFRRWFTAFEEGRTDHAKELDSTATIPAAAIGAIGAIYPLDRGCSHIESRSGTANPMKLLMLLESQLGLFRRR